MKSAQPAFSVVADQIARQPEALRSFLAVPQARAPPGSLFVGAGDSYAASSITSYFSSMRHAALDPYELTSDPGIATGKTIYFATVSGNTASGISAARVVEKIAKKRIAITANPEGKIASAVDEVVRIPFSYLSRLPGTLSFSLTLLALLKTALGRFDCDLAGAYSRARRDAGKVLLSDRGVTYFLGSGAAFPVCQYSALKMHELLGARAQAERLEEFGHAPVFSLRRDDAVNIFCAFDPLRVGEKLTASLRERGFAASAVLPSGPSRFDRTFYLIFLAQIAALRRARSIGLTRPYFTGATRKLAVSDSMIY